MQLLKYSFFTEDLRIYGKKVTKNNEIPITKESLKNKNSGLSSNKKQAKGEISKEARRSA